MGFDLNKGGREAGGDLNKGGKEGVERAGGVDLNTGGMERAVTWLFIHAAISLHLLRSVGPRSKVWCEREMINQAEWDLSEVTTVSAISKVQLFCF